MHASIVRQPLNIPAHCLQVSDPSLPDSGGDGLHSRADGVQQVGQLTCAVGLPALLQHKPGEGQNVGVESSSVGHLAVRRGTGTLRLKWYNVSADRKLKSELQSQDKGAWGRLDQSKVPFLEARGWFSRFCGGFKEQNAKVVHCSSCLLFYRDNACLSPRKVINGIVGMLSPFPLPNIVIKCAQHLNQADAAGATLLCMLYQKSIKFMGITVCVLQSGSHAIPAVESVLVKQHLQRINRQKCFCVISART